VPLVAQAVEALHAHRDRQTVERVIAADGYAAHDFVFADARGEPWRADGVTWCSTSSESGRPTCHSPSWSAAHWSQDCWSVSENT
jgi:hypothetical protein